MRKDLVSSLKVGNVYSIKPVVSKARIPAVYSGQRGAELEFLSRAEEEKIRFTYLHSEGLTRTRTNALNSPLIFECYLNNPRNKQYKRANSLLKTCGL